MLPLRALVVFAALVGGCGNGQCRTVATDRDAVTGTATYQPPSTTTPFTMKSADVWDMGRSSLFLDLDLRADIATRPTRVSIEGLSVGPTKTLDDATHAEACLVQKTDAAPTCLPLTGTVEVRKLDADCWTHESGISVCAENIDVTLHASSQQDGIDLHVDVDVVRTEHWTDTTCEAD